jgi:hypothetical protein
MSAAELVSAAGAEAGLSVRAPAEAAGVAASTVHRIERAELQPTPRLAGERLMLTTARILALFADLDAELGRSGLRGDVFVVGGAAMAVAYDARPVTRDVDGIRHPSREVREAAARVAARHDVELDWLNDGVKGSRSRTTTLAVAGVQHGSLGERREHIAQVDRGCCQPEPHRRSDRVPQRHGHPERLADDGVEGFGQVDRSSAARWSLRYGDAGRAATGAAE